MYKIDRALGKFIIIEPYEQSKVMVADEIATVFKVISVGNDTDSADLTNTHLTDTLIVVEKGSVLKTVMGDKDVYYTRSSDVVAIIKHDQ